MSLKNKRSYKVALDLMGSDHSPKLLLKAAFDLAQKIDASHEFVLIGTPSFKSTFNSFAKDYHGPVRFSYEVAKESIEMNEDPLKAVRQKKESSICLGMKLLKEKAVDAFVSAGNTGALFSSAKVYLSTLPGVLRPALLATLPTAKDPLVILDVGANIQSKSEHLVQFAQMGSAFYKSMGKSKPRVGLLNIGTEETKGTVEIKKAYKELKKKKHRSFEFLGNVEGKDAFEGNVDVLVTNGFTGNVFLKTLEGFSGLILNRIAKHIPQEDQHLVLKGLKKYLHYSDYPGALLIGVQGLVIKCHGYSSTEAIMNGISGAIDRLDQKLIDSIKANL